MDEPLDAVVLKVMLWFSQFLVQQVRRLCPFTLFFVYTMCHGLNFDPGSGLGVVRGSKGGLHNLNFLQFAIVFREKNP